MDDVWGPADKTRGALAFVHIPPYVHPQHGLIAECLCGYTCRHTVQAVWETLNSTINPGLDGMSRLLAQKSLGT